MFNLLLYIAVKPNFFHAISQNISLFMLIHLVDREAVEGVRNIVVYDEKRFEFL